MKEVMFLLVQMWASNLTIITYSPRKDQSNAYRRGWGKWREKVQEQHRDYLLQSWKLFTLVFLGPCCQRDRLTGNDKVYPRRAKPRSVYHSATWKTRIRSSWSIITFPRLCRKSLFTDSKLVLICFGLGSKQSFLTMSCDHWSHRSPLWPLIAFDH